MADRFAYFPMIGIYVLVAWLPLRRVVIVAAPLLVAASAALAFVQVGYWQDNDTLFGRAISVKDNETIRGYFGSWLIEQGRPKDALEQLHKAVDLAPESDFAHERLGVGLAAIGRDAEAIQEFKRAIAIRDDQPAYYTRLAAVLAREGKDVEAAEYFARAVRLMPELSAIARRRQEKDAIDPIVVPPGPMNAGPNVEQTSKN
jgi:tetratricopeptide (TPR) repeat protein